MRCSHPRRISWPDRLSRKHTPSEDAQEMEWPDGQISYSLLLTVLPIVLTYRDFNALAGVVFLAMSFDFKSKYVRKLLGFTPNRRSNALRNASALLNPTDSATLSID